MDTDAQDLVAQAMAELDAVRRDRAGVEAVASRLDEEIVKDKFADKIEHALRNSRR